MNHLVYKAAPIRIDRLRAELTTAGVPYTVVKVRAADLQPGWWVNVVAADAWSVVIRETVEAHVAGTDWVVIRKQETLAEWERRRDAVADDPEQVRMLYRMMLVLNKKIEGIPLDAADLQTISDVQDQRDELNLIRAAALAIRDDIDLMTEAQAETFDVLADPRWP